MHKRTAYLEAAQYKSSGTRSLPDGAEYNMQDSWLLLGHQENAEQFYGTGYFILFYLNPISWNRTVKSCMSASDCTLCIPSYPRYACKYQNSHKGKPISHTVSKKFVIMFAYSHNESSSFLDDFNSNIKFIFLEGL